MPVIEFEGVRKRYGRNVVLDDLTATMDEGAFNVVLGPPASGKSVLLRVLTGLEAPDAGHVSIAGQRMDGVAPGDRNVGYVPQSFALYPHYSVLDNITYPLRLAGSSKRDAREAAERIAAMLRIDKLLGKMPNQLSGGEKQRVAIARGIVKDTDLFVLDDPLTGLDFKLREQLFDDLRDMRRTLGATFVYTTSEPLESLVLADTIHILYAGRIVESGAVDEVYRSPRHLRSIEQLGFPASNVLDGTVSDEGGHLACRTTLFSVPVTMATGKRPPRDGASVRVAIRPEHLRLERPAGDAVCAVQAEVVLAEDLGGELVVHLAAQGVRITTVVRHDRALELNGGQVELYLRHEDVVVFDTDALQAVARGGV